MFSDTALVTFKAGKGGSGIIAWRREKYIPKGGPSGGNGGHGGSIYLKTDSGLFSLESFRHRRIICSKNGADGGSNLKQGKNGEDIYILIPCGTLIKDATTKEILFDCDKPGMEILLCQGGRGGKGNNCFKTPTHQAPHVCTAGQEGETKEIELELKLIADVGLLGMPNAGKSTLLSRLTKARVKIGAYPFTTLSPNISFIQFDDFSRILIADVPGIIEDAHLNRGLGLSFLKHIERTNVLVYLIDISPVEGRDPWNDYMLLKKELEFYNKALLERPSLIVLNKIDEEGALDRVEAFKKSYEGDPSLLFPISAKEGTAVFEFIHALKELTQAAGKRFV